MMNMINMAIFNLQMKVRAFFAEEDGDTNIVSMVVLIGIAVLLAVVFKDAIGNLIRDLLETITGTATDVVNTPA